MAAKIKVKISSKKRKGSEKKLEKQFVADLDMKKVTSWLYSREQIDYNHDIGSTLNEMVESIKTKGIIEPILVRTEKEGFEGIAGYLRFLASQKANMTTINAIVYSDITDLEATDLLVTENVMRQEMSDFDLANVLNSYVLQGISQNDIAQRISKSKSFVSLYLSLIKDSEPIRKALAEKNGFTEKQARAIRKLPEKLQTKAIEQIQGKTVRETEQRVKEITVENKTEMIKSEIAELELRIKEIDKAEDERLKLEQQDAELEGQLRTIKFSSKDTEKLVGKLNVLKNRYFPSMKHLEEVKARIAKINEDMPKYNIDETKKERDNDYVELAKKVTKVKELEEQLMNAKKEVKYLEDRAKRLNRSISYATSMKKELGQLELEQARLAKNVNTMSIEYANEISNFDKLKESTTTLEKEAIDKQTELMKAQTELRTKIRSMNGKIANRTSVKTRIAELKSQLKETKETKAKNKTKIEVTA